MPNNSSHPTTPEHPNDRHACRRPDPADRTGRAAGRPRPPGPAGYDLPVFKVGAAVYAIDDSCPHAGASLSGGIVQGRTVACRAHGLKFDMTHGCPHDPAKLQVRTHGLRVTDGMVMLDPNA